MKKPSNWSICGMAFGLLFSLLSSIRYFVMYPDEDKAIVYAIIGLIIVGLSWLYNRQLQISNTITAIEDYLADMEKGR